ncbi:transposase [Beggiatoa sp. PS]|nr:transposase [Beggiatoa sp. PS]
MSQGKNLTPEQKQAIVQVKKFMDAERSRGESVSTNQLLEQQTLWGLVYQQSKMFYLVCKKRQGQIFDPPKIKGHRKAKIDSYQNYIRSENDSECSLSIRTGNRTKIIIWLEEKELLQPILHYAEVYLFINFFYGNVTRRSALKEREYVVAARKRYLAAIRSNKDKNGFTVRPYVYLDETFVHVNHRKNFELCG